MLRLSLGQHKCSIYNNQGGASGTLWWTRWGWWRRREYQMNLGKLVQGGVLQWLGTSDPLLPALLLNSSYHNTSNLVVSVRERSCSNAGLYRTGVIPVVCFLRSSFNRINLKDLGRWQDVSPLKSLNGRWLVCLRFRVYGLVLPCWFFPRLLNWNYIKFPGKGGVKSSVSSVTKVWWTFYIVFF